MSIQVTRGACIITFTNPDEAAKEMLGGILQQAYEKKHQEWCEELRVAVRKLKPGESVVVQTPFETIISRDPEPEVSPPTEDKGCAS